MLFGFTDLGMVKVDEMDSDKWHFGYGGGLYLSPLNENFNITLQFAASEEERLLVDFTFGFRL